MSDNAKLIDVLLRRFEALREIRARNEKLRWEAFAYANHRTKSASIDNSPVPDLRLYSTAGVTAIETFVNGFMGNLVSINQNWASFRYESQDYTNQDDIPGANEYLGLVQKRVMSELAQSNFYPQDRLACKDAFIGGCSATYIHNDPINKISVFDTLPPWDWWCDMNSHGEYDTFFYKKTMSSYKAYDMFGEDTPLFIQDDARLSESQQYHDFLLCIYPRTDFYKKDSIFKKNKKFGMVWLYMGGTYLNKNYEPVIIKEDGLDRFPVIIHTWDSDGDNPYGTSPVIRALPDLKRLNMLAYETALTVQKINHAPTVMTAAVSEKFSDNPGSKIIVPSMEQAPLPLQLNQTVDGALALQKEQEEYIQRIFYNDMFNYLSRQDKVYTATQVNAVKSEELSLLSAIFGNVQSQKINKTIKYVIHLMSKYNRLPSGANKALEKGGKLKIVLDSMLAQSLRAYTFRDSGLATLELAERICNMARLDPSWVEANDNIDKNNLVRGIIDGNGSDPSVKVDKAKVLQAQELRRQQQQLQAQQQQALDQSEMVRNLGGASNMNNSTGANQYT